MRRVLGAVAVLGAIVLGTWTARAATTSDVSIEDSGYAPPSIGISAGDTVLWTNNGQKQHTVTARDGSFDSSPSCTSPITTSCLASGQTYSHAFTEPGTVAYYCKVHGFSGTIVVTAPPTTATSSTTSTTVEPTTTTGTSTTTSTSEPSDLSQAPLPDFSSTSRVALPRSVARQKNDDNLTALVLVDVAIAGATVIAGVVLVRKGRVPFG